MYAFSIWRLASRPRIGSKYTDTKDSIKLPMKVRVVGANKRAFIILSIGFYIGAVELIALKVVTHFQSALHPKGSARQSDASVQPPNGSDDGSLDIAVSPPADWRRSKHCRKFFPVRAR